MSQMTEAERYEKIKKRTVDVENAMSLLSCSDGSHVDWFSEYGKEQREYYEILDCCIRPIDDNDFCSLEEFKACLEQEINLLGKHIDGYHDQTNEYCQRCVRVKDRLIRLAHKFKIEI